MPVVFGQAEHKGLLRMRRSQGVTLIELIATISIIAILSSIAAPSFIGLRSDAERTTTVNDFLHALFLARSESIKRGQVVSICKSADGSTCAGNGANWNDGWIVFANSDRDDLPVRDPEEPVLLVNSGWQAGSIASNRQAYSFRPYQQAVVNGTIVFCDRRGSAHARAIIISHTGRPRVAQRDSSNRPLRCPASAAAS
jgi:type IV fimbrial biogenesis protein FimT